MSRAGTWRSSDATLTAASNGSKRSRPRVMTTSVKLNELCRGVLLESGILLGAGEQRELFAAELRAAFRSLR